MTTVTKSSCVKSTQARITLCEQKRKSQLFRGLKTNQSKCSKPNWTMTHNTVMPSINYSVPKARPHGSRNKSNSRNPWTSSNHGSSKSSQVCTYDSHPQPVSSLTILGPSIYVSHRMNRMNRTPETPWSQIRDNTKLCSTRRTISETTQNGQMGQ